MKLSPADLDRIKDMAHAEFLKRPAFEGVDIQAWCILKATQRFFEYKGLPAPFLLPEWEQENSLPIDCDGIGPATPEEETP